MIEIPKNIDYKVVERLMSELESSPGTDSIDLKIPIGIQFLGFIALPSFVQLLISWKRSERCGRLFFDINLADEAKLFESVHEHVGLVASVLAWDQEILSLDNQNLKPYLKKYNKIFKDFLSSGNILATVHDNGIFLPFFDHIPPNEGLLSILYHNGALRNEDDFNNVSDSYAELISGGADIPVKYLTKVLNDIQPKLDCVLFEAFENTHKWARQAATGKLLNPGLRGIFVKFHQIKKKNIEHYTVDGFDDYFREINHRNPHLYAHFKGFLEISVLDSGSGLVEVYSQRRLDTMTTQEEYEELIKALKKNNTSHKSVGSSIIRGKGLHEIMETLTRVQGFLQIRSGRMHVYRAFLKTPFYDDRANRYYYHMIDIHTKSALPSNHTRAQGTVMTFIIPLPITL